jgi:TATA box-binding protein-associated factor RNA polymerase I subunit D
VGLSDHSIKNFCFSSDSSSSGRSLFKTQCIPSSPKWRQRNSLRKFDHSPESLHTDSSSDSSLEPRPLTLKAIFERFKNKKHKKRKYNRQNRGKLRPRGRPKESRSTRRSSQIDLKQIKDKGTGFPFLQCENGRKPLPWRKILTFEVSQYLYIYMARFHIGKMSEVMDI